MKPTNPHRPKGLLSGPGGPRRRISQPMILATAFVLTASGGVGVTAASAATPVTPPDTAEPVVTATVTITPTAAPTEISTDSPTATPTTEVPLVGPFLGALHGEVVVPTKDGCGTVTVFTQTGQAVAVADDSITVRSQDGFERSYAIGDSTRTLTGRRGGEIRQDAWISVIASVQPGTQAPAPDEPGSGEPGSASVHHADRSRNHADPLGEHADASRNHADSPGGHADASRRKHPRSSSE